MQVEVLAITSPRKANLLANASVRISFDTHFIVISDFRVLRNRTGELWVAGPNYSIPNGRDYRYEPTVLLDRVLMAQVTDAILAAYEKQGAQS